MSIQKAVQKVVFFFVGGGGVYSMDEDSFGNPINIQIRSRNPTAPGLEWDSWRWWLFQYGNLTEDSPCIYCGCDFGACGARCWRNAHLSSQLLAQTTSLGVIMLFLKWLSVHLQLRISMSVIQFPFGGAWGKGPCCGFYVNYRRNNYCSSVHPLTSPKACMDQKSNWIMMPCQYQPTIVP